MGSSFFDGSIGMNGTHDVIANMKKILCIGVFCWAVMCLCAQPAGHFRQGDHHWDKVERLMAKNGYSHRLASFRTDDNYQFCNFFYDGSGRLVAIRDTVRNEYSLIDSLSYNDRGQMVRMSGWQLLNGVWENVYYIDYAYDEAGNRISRANYNNFDGDWELGGVYNYTYDSYGNIVLSQLTMGGIVFQKVEYTYSHPGGDLVCELWYGYDGMGLYPSEKIVTEWVAGKKNKQYDSISEDGVLWQYNGHSEYLYDDDGNCIEFHQYDRTGGEVDRSVYTINTELPLSQTYMPWTPESTRPKTYQNVHAYDREAWYSVDVDHILRYVCNYLYEYEENTAGIQSAEALQMTVFPNPAHGFVSLKGLDCKYASVNVVDVLGKNVMKCIVSPESGLMDVRTLTPGLYILHVATVDGVASVRLVIE